MKKNTILFITVTILIAVLILTNVLYNYEIISNITALLITIPDTIIALFLLSKVEKKKGSKK